MGYPGSILSALRALGIPAEQPFGLNNFGLLTLAWQGLKTLIDQPQWPSLARQLKRKLRFPKAATCPALELFVLVSCGNQAGQPMNQTRSAARPVRPPKLIVCPSEAWTDTPSLTLSLTHSLTHSLAPSPHRTSPHTSLTSLTSLTSPLLTSPHLTRPQLTSLTHPPTHPPTHPLIVHTPRHCHVPVQMTNTCPLLESSPRCCAAHPEAAATFHGRPPSVILACMTKDQISCAKWQMTNLAT